MNPRPYDVRQLFYPTMFGGVIPIIVLGSRNARRLNVNPKITNFLTFLGVLVLFCEVLVVSFLTEGKDSFANQFSVSIFRGLPMLLYFSFYVFLKKPLERAKESGIELIPLGKDGVIWALMGLFGEILIVFLGSQWFIRWV